MRPLTTATARRLGVLVAAAATLALAACAQDRDSVPAACIGEPAGLVSALRRAPRTVALPDGTRLSHCVDSARTDADLQGLGFALGRTADLLQARTATDPAAAVQLGYLAGAVRAGAHRATSGIAEQLGRRIAQLAALQPGAGSAAATAWARGARAGERSG